MSVIKVGNSLFKMTINKALSIARSGDVIRLAAGKYQIKSVINKSLTFEPDQEGSVVVLTGSMTIDKANCVFKNIELECNISDQSLIVAKQSNLMFEHCYFYGTQVTLARAISLTASSLTAYYCSFSALNSNAIKASDSSKIRIYNSIFKDLQDSSAIYLYSSQLDIKETSFINIAANAINAIGLSHINAADCEWQVTQSPALYLNPTVKAKITHSVFKCRSTAIVGQKATLDLQFCDFKNLDSDATINSKPATVVNHLFKGMNHSSVIEIENSELNMQTNHFINIPIHAIEAIGCSRINAQDCLWQVNNMAVLYLHPTGSAVITNSILKGRNAIICVQEANLTLEGCELVGITDNHTVKVKQEGQLVIINCLFKEIANFSTVKVESASLELRQSRFSHIQTNAVKAIQNSRMIIDNCQFEHISQSDAVCVESNSQAKITNSYIDNKVIAHNSLIPVGRKQRSDLIKGISVPSEISRGDLWFLDNETVDKLQTNLDRNS